MIHFRRGNHGAGVVGEGEAHTQRTPWVHAISAGVPGVQPFAAGAEIYIPDFRGETKVLLTQIAFILVFTIVFVSFPWSSSS